MLRDFCAMRTLHDIFVSVCDIDLGLIVWIVLYFKVTKLKVKCFNNKFCDNDSIIHVLSRLMMRQIVVEHTEAKPCLFDSLKVYIILIISIDMFMCYL